MAEESFRKLSDLEDLPVTSISDKPWANALLQNVIEISQKSVLHWCRIMAKIGEPPDKYVELFTSQLEKICLDLILDLEGYQEKIVDKLEQKLLRLSEICKDLKIPMPEQDYFSVDTPLASLLEMLDKQLKEQETILLKRHEEINELNEKSTLLCKDLGRPLTLLPIHPLPKEEEIESHRTLIEILEQTKIERLERFFITQEKIREMASKMGYETELDIEGKLLIASEPLITDTDAQHLEDFYKKLKKRSKIVQESIDDIWQQIDGLWNKLEIDFVERNEFQMKLKTKCSLEILRLLKEEAKRCDVLKKANIKKFIDDQRTELIDWWQKCQCTDEERARFVYYHSDCYTEDLFELHEREVRKWQQFYEQNKEIFNTLEQYKNMWQQLLELEIKPQGVERYKNRGGQLLAEERQRNKLTKCLPKYEENLKALAQKFFDNNQKEFQSYGQTIPEIIAKLSDDREKEFKERLSAKKQKDQNVASGSASCSTGARAVLFPYSTPLSQVNGSALRSSSTTQTTANKRKLFTKTPVTKKIKMTTTGSATPKLIKTISERNDGQQPSTSAGAPAEAASTRPTNDRGLPKLNIAKVRRLSKKRRQIRLQKRKSNSLYSSKSNSSLKENPDMLSKEYEGFQRELSARQDIRSTAYGTLPNIVVTEFKTPKARKH